MSAPYYVAVYGGFLVIETYPDGAGRTITKVYTVPNVRHATPWPNFLIADSTAKWAVGQLYPPDLRYFAILTGAFA
jgi:hypothetical protein